MNRAVFLAAFLAFAATALASDQKIVCYFGSWAVYRPDAGKFDIAYIDPTLCTHLIYTFVGISTEGDVRVLDSWQDLPDNYGKDGFGRFNKLRDINPDVKTLVAIGGWNEGSSKYSQVVGNPTVRAKFVQNVVAFLKKYGFDGFDVDWEYPNQRGGVEADKQNYVELLKELRAEFDKEGFILSAAVGAAESSASQSYIISEMSKYLHFINLMSYDLHGSWDSTTGINAPLYPASRETGNNAKLNVDAAIEYWLAQGAPAEKLILGVPFYGRSFTLADPNNNGVGAPATGPGTAGPYTREAGMLGYNEICEQQGQGGWNVVREEEQQVPYSFKGNQWVGYDDIKSIEKKAEYIKSKGLGGAMIWSIETDDFHGRCGAKYPLLSTLNHVLRGGPAVPDVPRPPIDPTVAPPAPEPKPTPPPSSLCTHEGYVRDPNDCMVFYHCQANGDSWIISNFRCADGTAFDPAINACNHREMVPGC